MLKKGLRFTFRETMKGGFCLGETDPKAGEKKGKSHGSSLAMHACIEINDIRIFCDDPNHSGSISGSIDFTPFGENIPCKNGVFNLFTPAHDPLMKYMIYEMGFEHEDKNYYVAGKKEVKNDPGFDLWSDTTTLYTTLHEGEDKNGSVIGAGTLHLSVGELLKLIRTMSVPNTKSITEKMECIGRFGHFFLGDLWDSYMKMAKKN